MAIQILENTLLKLIVRQGSDYDRQQITLDSGELGYTTDNKRLFIGDGSTAGGNLVGNKFLGSVATATTVYPAEINDSVFETSSNTLKVLESNDGSSPTDWKNVGGLHTASDNTITFNASNQIAVNLPALSGVSIPPLYAKYTGSTDTTNFSKNGMTVTKISTGRYRFNFPSLGSSDYIPIVQIQGNANVDYETRIMLTTSTLCTIEILNSAGAYVDATVFFTIIR